MRIPDREFFEGIFPLQLIARLFGVAGGWACRNHPGFDQGILYRAPTVTLRMSMRIGIGDTRGSLHMDVVIQRDCRWQMTQGWGFCSRRGQNGNAEEWNSSQ